MHCEEYDTCQTNNGFIVHSVNMLALTIENMNDVKYVPYCMFNTAICSCSVGDCDLTVSAIDLLKVSDK